MNEYLIPLLKKTASIYTQEGDNRQAGEEVEKLFPSVWIMNNRKNQDNSSYSTKTSVRKSR